MSSDSLSPHVQNLAITAGSPTKSHGASFEQSLLGRWKLMRDGSDYLPGVDSLSDSPLVLKLLGNVEAEFYKIEKRKVLDCEEILLTYVAKNMSISRSYQVGILNFENVNNNDITLAVVQNCDCDFHEFSLLRLGPKAGQFSRESYKLDMRSDIIKCAIEVTAADGTRLTLIKYLARFDHHSEHVPSHYPENSSHHHHNHPTIGGNVPFIHSTNTVGWKLFDYWPSTVLSNAKVKIVRAIKIRTQNSIAKEPAKVLEVLWESSHAILDVDYRLISRAIGSKNSEGEEVVEFIIQVSMEQSSWVVAHRYREFDALRKFLLAQNPFTSQFQNIDAKFPGKTISLTIRKNALEKRIEGLEGYLSYYLENARYCRQNSIDALCSFLQLPEHMHAVATRIAEAEAAQAATLAAAHARAQALAPASSASQSASETVAPPNPAPKTKRLSIFGGRSNEDKEKEKEKEKPKDNSSTTTTLQTTVSTGPPSPSPSLPATTSSSSLAANVTATEAPASHSSTAVTATQGIALANPLNPELSAAQKRLLTHIGGHGIAIIKHGRQGAPKNRILTCDDEVTELIVQASDSHYKKCLLSEVEAIRLGTDVDPATPKEALERLAAEAAGTVVAPPSRSISKKASSRISILGGVSAADTDGGILYGTSILRRTCKKEDMSMCISLISPNRTFDIQCLKVEDLQILYSCLKDICLNAQMK